MARFPRPRLPTNLSSPTGTHSVLWRTHTYHKDSAPFFCLLVWGLSHTQHSVFRTQGSVLVELEGPQGEPVLGPLPERSLTDLALLDHKEAVTYCWGSQDHSRENWGSGEQNSCPYACKVAKQVL